jgi:hypothetical protein
VRVVGLVECGTHACVSAAIGGHAQLERELTDELVPDLRPGMLVLADRGFYGYDMWRRARQSGADLLWRVQTRYHLPVEQALPDGSYRSTLLPGPVRADLRRGKARRLEDHQIPVRVVDYQVGGAGEVIRLVTSVLDHELAPAAELAALYHQRWEIELVFDEIETHQIAGNRVLRSKTPDLVRQEIWALLLTHYAIRCLIAEAAEQEDIDPDRLSFIRSLRVIRRQVSDQAGFSPRPTE